MLLKHFFYSHRYIPVFVQLYQLQRKYFHGIYEASTFKINYDMVHLKSMPDDYYYLSELANLFRAKIVSFLGLNAVH